MVTALAAMAWVAAAPAWATVAPGVDYAVFPLEAHPSSGDGRAHVVRVDPRVAKLDLGLASQNDGTLRTAREWCVDRHFAVVINAGMYGKDYVSNVGYLRRGTHLNNARWNAKYQAVLAVQGKTARLWDRDAAPGRDFAEAELVVQNLRVLKGGGVRVWEADNAGWSEALVADDARGHLFFVFVQTPLPMKDLVGRLQGLGLGLEHAMHVEGGPEASLSIHTRTVNVDLAGGPRGRDFDAGKLEQWRIPNVLGVVAP